MILLQLFWEFCKVGLFSVGGGLATIPFLTQMGQRTGWFTSAQLADMIAVSESIPGPMGINMASYVGFQVGGVPGGVLATLGLVLPSIVIILVVAKFLQRFRQSRIVDGVFYGLRAASVALITASMLQVARIALLRRAESIGGNGEMEALYWPANCWLQSFLYSFVLPRPKSFIPSVLLFYRRWWGLCSNCDAVSSGEKGCVKRAARR